MGVDLATPAENVNTHYNWRAWRYLLKLACKHGWKPKGTKAPIFTDEKGNVVQSVYKDWDGSYFYNEYQQVTSKDAKNIAKALKRVSSRVRATRPFISDFIRLCEDGSFLIG